jgi:hypothetical protein
LRKGVTPEVWETLVTNKTKSQKAAVVAPAVDEQRLAELVKRAQADGVSLTGEGGLVAEGDQGGAGVDARG